MNRQRIPVLPVNDKTRDNGAYKAKRGLCKKQPGQCVYYVNIFEKRNQIIRECGTRHSNGHTKHKERAKVKEVSENGSAMWRTVPS